DARLRQTGQMLGQQIRLAHGPHRRAQPEYASGHRLAAWAIGSPQCALEITIDELADVHPPASLVLRHRVQRDRVERIRRRKSSADVRRVAAKRCAPPAL